MSEKNVSNAVLLHMDNWISFPKDRRDEEKENWADLKLCPTYNYILNDVVFFFFFFSSGVEGNDIDRDVYIHC